MTIDTALLTTRVSDAISKTIENHPDFKPKTIFVRLANGQTRSLSSFDKSGNPIRKPIADEQLTTLDYAKMLLTAHAADNCILEYYSKTKSGDNVSEQLLRAGDAVGTAQVLTALCGELQAADATITQAQNMAPNQNPIEVSEGILNEYYNPTTPLGNYLSSYEQLYHENRLPSYANFPDDDLQSLLMDSSFRDTTSFGVQLATIQNAADLVRTNSASISGQTR